MRASGERASRALPSGDWACVERGCVRGPRGRDRGYARAPCEGGCERVLHPSRRASRRPGLAC